MHREVVKLEYRIMELEQQRAELLEALKDVMSAVELGWIPYGESMFNAREAITRAEAAE